jgi:predicted Zn-dependent protease with MMP-like domain
VTLVFKLVDNQELESSVENLDISLTNAVTTTNDGMSPNLTIVADTANVAIVNDSFFTYWQTITCADANKAAISSDPNSGGKQTADNTSTIVIDSAHVGDNFIVVVDTVQSKVTTTAALGTTENSRYKESHNYTQTDLLTVWRTLWMELDQMAAPTATAADGFDPNDQGTTWDNTASVGEPINFDVLAQPEPPDISLLTTSMAVACIEVKEVSQDSENWSWIIDANGDLQNGGWRTETPFVHNMTDSDFMNGTNNRLGRDIATSAEFWTIHVLGAYEGSINNDFDASNENALRGYAPDNEHGSVIIFNETIRDFGSTTAGVKSVSDIKKGVVFHEVLHCFGLSHYDDGIMNSSQWVLETDTNWDHLLITQIKKVQAASQPVL